MRRRSRHAGAAIDTAALRFLAVLAVALIAGLSTDTVYAQGALAQPVPARAQVCAACHGAAGNSSMPDSPSLAGQPRIFVENTLVMIREGLRRIPVMQGQLDGVSDPEITALARYYAAQTLVPIPAARQPERFARGEALAARTHCASCHLPGYAGREQMPRLAGQREDYLLHSMRQFLDGSASGRDTIMAASLRGMSDEDLRDLAHYLSQIR